MIREAGAGPPGPSQFLTPAGAAPQIFSARRARIHLLAKARARTFSQSVLRGRPHHELIRSLAMRGAIRILLAIVGLVAIVLAVIYLIVPAGSLPLPDALGREAGSQVIHVKHGIAALVAGLLCWLLVWDMGSPPR